MYELGLQAMRASDYDRACLAFQESLRLESNPGSVYKLADCEDHRGRLATSSALYAEFVRRVALMAPDQAARYVTFRDRASARLDVMRPLVPSVKLKLPSGGPFEVMLDTLRLTDVLLTSDVPLDPGAHTWLLRSSAGERQGTFLIREGEHLELAVPAPVAVAVPPVASATPTFPAPVPGASSSPGASALSSASVPRTRSSWSTTTLVAGGIGLTATVVGVVAAGVAIGSRIKLGDECPGGACQPDDADTLRTARRAASLSTISLSVGAVGLATAAMAWWVGRPDPTTSAVQVTVSPSGGQLFWQQTW